MIIQTKFYNINFFSSKISSTLVPKNSKIFSSLRVKNVNNEYMHITMISISYKCIMDGIRLVLCDLI